MEISKISKDSIKVRSKSASIIVDPSTDMSKITCDGVLLLASKQAIVSKVENHRLVIEGAGEFEIAGIKISAFTLGKHLVYEVRVDSVEMLIAQSESLQATSEKVKEYHIVVVRVDTPINQSVITTLSPRVVILYGQKAAEEAKSLGKEAVQTVQKYQTTVEKLPEEMEVIILG